MPHLHKKTLQAIVLLCLIAAVTVFALYAGGPFWNLLSNSEALRAWVDEYGVWSKLAFTCMMALQVFVAFIPGEPLEIAAGYAFGAWEGTALCMLGALIGSAVVFLFVRKYGVKALQLFFSGEKINSVGFLKDTSKLHLLVFIIFFIPGTPKDILSYAVALTPMRLRAWLIISTIARIPSIVTSTIGGDALGMGNFAFAVIVFGITLLISALGLVVYQYIAAHPRQPSKAKRFSEKETNQTTQGIV